MTAMAAQKPTDVPWAKEVKFTENGVGIPVGEGIWGSIRSKSDFGLVVPDASTNTVAWYGLIYDHDAPAYAGVRLKVKGARVAEAEVIVARERNPGPWADPKEFTPGRASRSRRWPRASAPRARTWSPRSKAYARSIERNDGNVKAKFDACLHAHRRTASR